MMTQSTCYKGTKKMTVKGVLWHSTGANNPTLKRYVQPDDGAPDRAELLSKLGTNANKNDWNHIDTQAGLNAWIGKLADGSVAAPCGSNSELFASVQEGGMPLVLIDRYLPDAGMLSYVTTDNYRGAVMATEYLLENGHRRIACIQGTPHSMPVRDRVRGFGDTLRAHGLGDRIVVTGEDFSVQNGYLETKLALAQAERPTAIFALSNLILLGVVKAVHESGLRIPDDISVVSFDDNMLFNYLDPAITCIGQPTDEIGTLAVKLLIRAVREPGAAPSHLHLPPSLIIRRSVRNLLL